MIAYSYGFFIYAELYRQTELKKTYGEIVMEMNVGQVLNSAFENPWPWSASASIRWMYTKI